jgi:hypothetical protein
MKGSEKRDLINMVKIPPIYLVIRVKSKESVLNEVELEVSEVGHGLTLETSKML